MYIKENVRGTTRVVHRAHRTGLGAQAQIQAMAYPSLTLIESEKDQTRRSQTSGAITADRRKQRNKPGEAGEHSITLVGHRERHAHTDRPRATIARLGKV